MDGIVRRNTLIAPHEVTPCIAPGGTRSAAGFSGMFGEITESGVNPNRWRSP